MVLAPTTAAEFAALDAGRMADDPTIYACVSSVTDPTQAPAGCENWFLLVNAPPGIRLDRDAERGRVLDVLAGRGVDLRGAGAVDGRDHAARHGRPVPGAGRGDLRDVVERPAGGVPAAGATAAPARGLYLVGGSSHPGGGLPLVADERARSSPTCSPR